MTGPVLVDTSAWIAYLRPGDSPLDEILPQIVRGGRARLCGPVMSELLQGVRDNHQTARLNSLISALPFVEIERSDWLAAGLSLRRLRGQGITVPLSDALIATVAERRALDLLTLDAHFQHFEIKRLRIGPRPPRAASRSGLDRED
jgi:predicted nucleic acid-binding protein